MSRNRNEINPFDEWFPASAVAASTTEPESEAEPETLGLTWLETEGGGYWVLPQANTPLDHAAFLAEFEAAGSPAEWTDEAGNRRAIEFDRELGKLHVTFQTPRPANDDDPSGSAVPSVEPQAATGTPSAPGEAAPATGPPQQAILDHALAWAARGFRIFPIQPGAKVPPNGVSWKAEVTCRSAWNKDAVFGVIGVQSGPP